MTDSIKIQAEASVDTFSKKFRKDNASQLESLELLKEVARDLQIKVIKTPLLGFAEENADNFIKDTITSANHAGDQMKAGASSTEIKETYSKGFAAKELREYLELVAPGLYKSKKDMVKGLETLLNTIDEQRVKMNIVAESAVETKKTGDTHTPNQEATSSSNTTDNATEPALTGQNIVKPKVHDNIKYVSYGNIPDFKNLQL